MQLRHKVKGKSNRLPGAAVVLGVLAVLMLGPGCTREADLRFETTYQAVLLDTGQVFIGKLEQSGSAYPLLREVFYIQRLTEGDKKEVKNVLLKRGNEWHRPDYMRLNARHIVMIEPVAPESRMAKLIQEAKSPPAAAPPVSPPPTTTPKEEQKPPTSR
jgi:hypothetical protein